MRGKLLYYHVDVFSRVALSGNGLIVFFCDRSLNTKLMQSLTKEMRQIESIFLFGKPNSGSLAARIFTEEEELSFAGHPILGAAAALHFHVGSHANMKEWVFRLNSRQVRTSTEQKKFGITATMDQGRAKFSKPLSSMKKIDGIIQSLGLSQRDLHPGLPLQVVSTGLPYLIVPIRRSLEKSGIKESRFAEKLRRVGAKFVYVLDITKCEGRSWDNAGKIEDIATGSAAGPAAAFLAHHRIIKDGRITIHQGRFVGRPSEIRVDVRSVSDGGKKIRVEGDVVHVGQGGVNCE